MASNINYQRVLNADGSVSYVPTYGGSYGDAGVFGGGSSGGAGAGGSYGDVPTSVATTAPTTPVSGQQSNSASGSGGSSFGVNPLGAAFGVYETIKGAQELDKLNKTPFPEYSVSPELSQAFGKASQMSDIGYTNQEKLGFQGQLNQAEAGQRAAVTQLSGGNLANAIQGSMNATNIGARNTFAMSDAQLHRENLSKYYSLTQEMQNQKNLINQEKIRRRSQLEDQYNKMIGAGVQSILGNVSLGMGGASQMSGGSSGGSMSQLATLLPLLA